MWHYAVVFCVIALIASLLGYGGVAGLSPQIGWIFGAIALTLLVVALLGGRRGRRRPILLPLAAVLSCALAAPAAL